MVAIPLGSNVAGGPTLTPAQTAALGGTSSAPTATTPTMSYTGITAPTGNSANPTLTQLNPGLNLSSMTTNAGGSLALPGAAGGGGAPLPASNDATLQATVSSVLGLQSTAVTDAANATAATTSAAGYAAEGDAYQTAADIAGQNATVAGIAGTVKGLQEQRATNVTLGAQRAGVAAAGFAASGSSLDLLRSSMQQGYVTQQLNDIQTTLTKGGYIEEQAASNAEQVAARSTSATATATAAADTTAANMARATAASETAALNNFLGSYTLTADQSLLLSPLAAADSIASGGTGSPAGPTLTPSGLPAGAAAAGAPWVPATQISNSTLLSRNPPTVVPFGSSLPPPPSFGFGFG